MADNGTLASSIEAVLRRVAQDAPGENKAPQVEEAPQLDEEDEEIMDTVWEGLRKKWREEDIEAGIIKP